MVYTSIAMSDLSNVSISFTTAIVYLASGTFFFLLIFLLVMLGISDCHFLSRSVFLVDLILDNLLIDMVDTLLDVAAVAGKRRSMVLTIKLTGMLLIFKFGKKLF